MTAFLGSGTLTNDAHYLRQWTIRSCPRSIDCQTIHLVFSEDLSDTQHQALKQAAQTRRPNPRYLFEELAVDPHYPRAIDWFADRIQDGTIVTMERRPIVGRGEDDDQVDASGDDSEMDFPDIAYSDSEGSISDEQESG
ncbi:hypothetical protein CALCODRAFT_500044 [Calocera cornea HHB12733]|uniref:Uncharacterized protein n=1 Tax=Calocera cornea HHB12733 TaxID=1353952 RepID=A0A165E857_9BASI|nr:hypothetical protein CALCODRAFT_500044 [Calocera cornea HHB12733]